MKKKSLGGQQPIHIPAPLEQLNEVIVAAIHDVKGLDVVKIDLSSIPDTSADFFYICHGNSTTHVAGIVASVQRKVLEHLGIPPNHIEGKEGRHWMLIDYFSTLVHVFSPEKRYYYNIEQLWSDAPATHYDNVL